MDLTFKTAFALIVIAAWQVGYKIENQKLKIKSHPFTNVIFGTQILIVDSVKNRKLQFDATGILYK
ncbi:hypothetical protein [Tolypothrix tenuis]|uniref:hypothetical protein n=1 Tax=Tolypothrix tenuis TaxID=457083 RepID=UPI000BBC51C9